MLALSFKAYSVRSARLLLYMTAEAFIFLHSLYRPGFIFTGGFLRPYLVFPDWHEVSVSSTRLLSSYPLLYQSLHFPDHLCLLFTTDSKSFSLKCFSCPGHLKSCFWGFSSPFLCLIPLFSSSWFLPVQTFLLFCQILMVKLDTGFPFWRFSCSLFLASTDWHMKSSWSYVSVQFHRCLICKIWFRFPIALSCVSILN